MTRDCSVGVFAVVPGPSSKILLVKHGYEQKKWSLPGGGMEKGESLVETVVREVKEETGVLLKSVKLIGIFSLQESKGIAVLFEGRGVKMKDWDRNEGEIEQVGFFDPNELWPEIYPAQQKLIEWWLRNGKSDEVIVERLLSPKQTENSGLPWKS